VDTISRAITAVTGIEPTLSTSGGTSDGRFIADICPQVVEMGPRNATIHKINEYVEVRDLEQLPQIYRMTLENLLLKT
jgi:succinyl-diaminopimelate desuccinylase